MPKISLEQIGSNYPIKTSISALWIFSNPDTNKQKHKVGVDVECWLTAFKGPELQQSVNDKVWWWQGSQETNGLLIFLLAWEERSLPPSVLMTRCISDPSTGPAMPGSVECVRVSRQMRHMMRQGTLLDAGWWWRECFKVTWSMPPVTVPEWCIVVLATLIISHSSAELGVRDGSCCSCWSWPGLSCLMVRD